MCNAVYIISHVTIGKNFVASILGSPRGINKCKRILQLSDDDEVAKKQNPRKRKRKLLKV